VKATAIVTVLLALTGVGGAVAYQTVAQDRQYRRLVTAGDAALREDQTFGAIESYSGAIALRPDSMLAYLRRGETYERRGDSRRRGARLSGRPPSSRPRPRVPWKSSRTSGSASSAFGRAADLYAGVLRVDDHSAAVSYKHALAFYREGDLASAITALHQTLELDSGLTEAHTCSDCVFATRDAFPRRLAALERAVALAPGFVGAREELADLYAMLDRRNNQLEQLQIIAGLDPQRIERQIAIGQAHARSGHAELAVLTLRNALERARTSRSYTRPSGASGSTAPWHETTGTIWPRPSKPWIGWCPIPP
jgi:tetratricopeptide (TPR) repeat protein